MNPTNYTPGKPGRKPLSEEEKRERKLTRQRLYNQKNAEKIREQNKKYYNEHREEILEKMKKKRDEKFLNNYIYRIEAMRRLAKEVDNQIEKEYKDSITSRN